MTIAFFDFDGTLIRKDSGRICAVPSIRRGLLGWRIAVRLIGTYLLSKVGLRKRSDAQRVGFECYRGRTLAELRVLMQELYDQHLVPFLSAPMLERLAEHKGKGHHLVIVTASAFFFAEPIAKALGIGHVIGTAMVFDGELCTGQVDGEILDGMAKLEAAKRYADEHNVPLTQCTFYSYYPADLPLLEAVGTPVAVGPTRKLAKVARARGWTILLHAGHTKT